MFVSAFLSIVGLGFLVYVLFSLAVYALPFFVAVTVGMYVYDTEAGVLAALVAAMFAGAFTLIIGQIVFAKVQSVPVRLLIASLYAAPAGVAGFSAIKGLSQIGGASESWTLAFAIIGGIVVAGTAWVRIASLAGPPGEDNVHRSQSTYRQQFANDR
ncbi:MULTISPECIES: hypothetical protein [Alphaproteobacteria]|uniref:hypothetical protein n=1 Tax=Alphaproteobacteria TaxID=28211 RepID=UPI001572DC6F|nr:hypothetical protein [Agrobacterium tumefaciens]WCK16927.1 hypothetical protein G6L41_025680 [Agrobacterium tumefaciens]WIE36286.1 hypothetical protein G6L82_026440 [Agrobacterium tumefaciens]|tara:strand:- start:31882 stop:32352 length:471 start_codon:yes stop_codon:yes gene_type:complete